MLLQSNDAVGGNAAALAAIVAAAVATAVVVRLRLWRIPAETRGSVPVEASIWLLGALLAYVAGGFAMVLGIRLEDEAYGRLLVGALGNLLQAVTALLFVRNFTRPGRATAEPLPRALVAGVLGFLLISPIAAGLSVAVNAAMQALGQPPAPQASHATLAILLERRDPLLTALTLAHVALLVPLAEELIWRGMVQTGIRAALGARAGIALTAVMFTFIHWPAIAPDGRVVGLSMLLALALGLGILRERTGSVVAPVVVHAIFNAANVAIALSQNSVSSTT